MDDRCMLRIRDREVTFSGRLPATVIHQLVAGVSAEPVTVEELWSAAERFCRGIGKLWRSDGQFPRDSADDGHDPCRQTSLVDRPDTRPSTDQTETSSPDVLIDLIRRTIACRTAELAERLAGGTVAYFEGERHTPFMVSYHLPERWRVVSFDEAAWEPSAAERSADIPREAREVLYGVPLLQYILRQVRRLWHQADRERSPEDDSGPLLTRLELEDALRSIHIGWLCRPLSELQGRSPREILLARQVFLALDMADREDQWSMLDEPPPALATTSFAYRYGGFGAHEIVLYYELVRELLYEAWQQVADGISVADGELDRLAKIRERWLDTPQMDLFERTPRAIIEQERRRLPILASPDELLLDCHCPMCRLMAECPGPTFWHLDESGMDAEFAMSLNLSRDD
jgi:hypothetical protein